MAGSGSGRGHASFAFNMEVVGFGKGAALPDVICKPPPPLPSTDNKPVETTKKMLYLLTAGDQYQKFVYVLFIYMFIYYSGKTEVVKNMC
uniref:Uncharacterized protein n=1 Tax=Taeniopygia guttata TaxID=59729 RepID=A0A674GGA3_TAEGU